jgi:hypothetical protein
VKNPGNLSTDLVVNQQFFQVFFLLLKMAITQRKKSLLYGGEVPSKSPENANGDPSLGPPFGNGTNVKMPAAR